MHIVGLTDVFNVFSSYIASFRLEEVTPPLQTADSFTAFRGVTLFASLCDFGSSDDLRASFNPGFTLNSDEAPVWLIFDATVSTASAFSVESNAGTPGLSFTTEAFNWNTATFDVLGVEPASFNADSIVTYDVVPADHVNANNEVRSRVGWRQTGFTLNFPWQVNVDQVGWVQ